MAAAYIGSVEDGIIRSSDNVFIARNADNPDWQAYLQWLALGNLPDPPVIPPMEYAWYIDIGPFFDRFGSAKMNVLTSANVVAKAVVTDCMVRKWIDLQNPSVAAGIDALINAAIPGVDTTLKNTILTTPVTAAEQSALVHMFFSRGRHN